MVRVLYFAAARERAGCAAEDVSWEGGTVHALLDELKKRHPALAAVAGHLRVAVDEAFVEMDSAVPPGSVVALIPPVAGGSDLFRVVNGPILLQEVVDAVSGEGAGGIVTFSGAVRESTRGRQVLRLEYEAYVPMAEKQLTRIAAELTERWPGTRLAILHRTGTLLPGELAVVIAASAPHRKEAFLACEAAIDRLKQSVPIWKKEVYADGEIWVGLGP